MNTTEATPKEEESTLTMFELSSEGEKSKKMRLYEALLVVRAALKSGKLVFKTDDGKTKIIRSEKEITKQTKEVGVAPAVKGG